MISKINNGQNRYFTLHLNSDRAEFSNRPFILGTPLESYFGKSPSIPCLLKKLYEVNGQIPVFFLIFIVNGQFTIFIPPNGSTELEDVLPLYDL